MRIQPQSLIGSRVYFVDFDHRRIKNIRNHKTWENHISRKFKTILLSKRSIVCAASHLKSPLVYGFIRKNSFLLEQGLLIPALRSDIEEVSDYIT